MKIIEFTNPHRKKHFDFFKNMNHPHFNIGANVDISNLFSFLKNKSLPFTPTVVYLIAHTANALPEFRRRIRGDQIIEHEIIHPSFSVITDVADVFSFCEVPYRADFQDFIEDARQKIEKMKKSPSFEDDHGRDDYLFLSAFPWMSFTSFQHAMNYHPGDSVPRITWGKFFEENGKMKMPVSVQVHHALVDGRHVGRYLQKLEDLTKQPEGLLER